MTVECVTVETNHLFDGNPLAEQHRLRYRAVIERQLWDIPQIRDLEYDQYDNPATTYLIWRNDDGSAGGVSRLYPTDRPFMLQEHFGHLVTDVELPKGEDIWEGSRFCIDRNLPPLTRQAIARELILAYLEFGLEHDINQYIGVMHPAYWQNLFVKVGWQPCWFGDSIRVDDGKMARAGGVWVSREALNRVRSITGITRPVIDYGREDGGMPWIMRAPKPVHAAGLV